MSYCRFGLEGSDVYIFESDRGIECCGCRFQEDFFTNEPEEMISHLARHRRANHFVPPDVIPSLWSEIPGALRPSENEAPIFTYHQLLAQIAMLNIEASKAKERMEALDFLNSSGAPQ